MLRTTVVALKVTLAVLAVETFALQPSMAQAPQIAIWLYQPVCPASFPSRQFGRVTWNCSLPPPPLLYPGDRCYVGLLIDGAKIWSSGVVEWWPRFFGLHYPTIDCLWGGSA